MLATLFYWQTGSKEIIIQTNLINSAPSIEDEEPTACVKTPALWLTVSDVALSATVTCGPKMADSDKRVRKRNQEWDMSSLHSYWIKPMFLNGPTVVQHQQYLTPISSGPLIHGNDLRLRAYFKAFHGWTISVWKCSKKLNKYFKNKTR